MKILHLMLDPIMWQPAQFHIQNLHYLEGGMGIETLCDYASVDGLNVNQYGECDIIHIHGWPIYQNAPSFLRNFKQILLTKSKIIISMYNYSPLCSRATMENNDKECDPDACSEELCIKTRNIRDIIQDINIFVYSNNSYNIYKKYGFKNIHKMPICCYGNIAQYVKPSYNELINKRIAFFDFGSDLSVELESIYTMKKMGEDSLKIYPIRTLLHPFEVNYSFIPMFWKCAMPTTMGVSFRTGAPVVLVGNGYGNDYHELSPYIHNLGLDWKDKILDLFNLEQTEKERNEVSYSFWKNYGPDVLKAWYSSAYQYINIE